MWHGVTTQSSYARALTISRNHHPHVLGTGRPASSAAFPRFLPGRMPCLVAIDTIEVLADRCREDIQTTCRGLGRITSARIAGRLAGHAAATSLSNRSALETMLPHPIVRVTSCRASQPRSLCTSGLTTAGFKNDRLCTCTGTAADLTCSSRSTRVFRSQQNRSRLPTTLVWPNDADFDPATLALARLSAASVRNSGDAANRWFTGDQL